MKNVSIIGVGRVGGALALALSEAGYTVGELFDRSGKHAARLAGRLDPAPRVGQLPEKGDLSGRLVIIATQDSEIENVARRLSGFDLSGGSIVYHTSGSHSSEILGPAGDAGCPTGSIHPLVSVSDPETGAGSFDGAFFCVEGVSAAVGPAERLVRAIGGSPFTVPTASKALYHAAAVTSCGHLVALVDASVEMLRGCGLGTADAKKILLPLIESTVSNISRQDNAAALTGTFARGDVETLDRHLAVLAEHATPEIIDIYLSLGRRSLDLAEKQGADPRKLEEMARKISLAKTNFRC